MSPKVGASWPITWTLLVGIALLGTVLFGVDPARAEIDDRIQPGQTAKIVLDEKASGFRRSYWLHVPAGWKGEPRPLVIALHGGVATGKILEKQTAFSELADQHEFFVAYPNGLGIFSLLRHWNGGFCCARAAKIDLDDVGYVDRIRARIEQDYTIDSDRVYLVGYSNGGFLAYWYAAVHGEKLAGLAIWASSIGSVETPERSWQQPTPLTSVPTFIAHGLDDPRLPFETPGARGGQQLLGAVGSADFWREVNGCDEEPNLTTECEEAVTVRTWCGDSTAPVQLMSIRGWGHEWPGPKRTDRKKKSNPLHGFHLAQKMWEFFDSLP